MRVAPVPPVPEEAPTLQPAPHAVTPEWAEADVEGVKGDQRAKLMEIVIRNIAKHQEKLHAALEKAPESAKPALLQAIAELDAQYEEILEALREKEKD